MWLFTVFAWYIFYLSLHDTAFSNLLMMSGTEWAGNKNNTDEGSHLRNSLLETSHTQGLVSFCTKYVSFGTLIKLKGNSLPQLPFCTYSVPWHLKIVSNYLLNKWKSITAAAHGLLFNILFKNILEKKKQL